MPSLRPAAGFGLLLLMELLAGFALIVGVGITDYASPGFALFWFVLLAGVGGLMFGLGVSRLRLRSPWDRVALLAGGVLTAVLPAWPISPGWFVALLVAIVLSAVYWRGLAISQVTPSVIEVRARFGIGFGVIFVGLLWLVARGVAAHRGIWYLLALVGVAYTITAMAALVLTRVESEREPGSGKAVFLAVTLQLGLVAVLAVIAVQIFALDVAGVIWHVVRPFFDTVGGATYRFVLLFAQPIDNLISLIRGHGSRNLPSAGPSVTGTGNAAHKQIHPGYINVAWLVAAAILLAAAVLAGLAVLIWRALPRIERRSSERGFSEERETLTLAEIWHAILAWLRALLHQGSGKAAELRQRARRRLFGEYPADPVRRIYAQLLRRAGAAGLPRPLDATPAEYKGALIRRWPDVAFDLSAITDAYIVRRYGDVAPNPYELDRLSNHWQHVRHAIRIPRLGRTVAPAQPETPDTAMRPRFPLLHEIGARIRPLFFDPETNTRHGVLVWVLCLVAPFAAVGIAILLALLTNH